MLSCRQVFGTTVPHNSPSWEGKAGIVFQLLLVSCLSLTKVTPLGLNGVFPVVWRSPSGQLVGRPGPIPHRVVLHGRPEVLGAGVSTSVRGTGVPELLEHMFTTEAVPEPFLPQGDGDSQWFGETRWPQGRDCVWSKQPELQCGEGQAVLEKHINWISSTVPHK